MTFAGLGSGSLDGLSRRLAQGQCVQRTRASFFSLSAVECGEYRDTVITEKSDAPFAVPADAGGRGGCTVDVAWPPPGSVLLNFSQDQMAETTSVYIQSSVLGH